LPCSLVQRIKIIIKGFTIIIINFIMGAKPLLKTRIAKKHIKKVQRFQSDRFMRVSVSIASPTLTLLPQTQSLTPVIDFMEKAKRYRWKS